MKRTYLARRNAFFRTENVTYGAGALGVVVLLLLMRLIVPNLFWRTVVPLLTAGAYVSDASHAVFSSFSNATTLAAKKEELERENTSLASENQILTLKIADLSRLLGDTTTTESPTSIVAGVLARPPESPYDSLLVAAGSRAGVQVGMEAFAEGGIPIGVVETVASDFAQILLFTSPNTSVAGSVGKSGIPLTLTGKGGGVVAAAVARTASVLVGDVVSVPGPGSLPVGVVAQIDSDPSSPAVELRIKMAANLFTVRSVLLRSTGVVVRPSTPSATTTTP